MTASRTTRDSAPGRARARGSKKAWTVLVYLGGDNDLDAAGADDLDEMKSVGSTDDVDVVAQFDRAGETGRTHRYHLRNGTTLAQDRVGSLGETNTGDPAVLEDFLLWGAGTFPSERTLVVLASEFGRTPEINGNEGRDHWPRVWSAMLAGGGIVGGRVHGESTPGGHEVAKDPVQIGQLHATVCKALGIDPTAQNTAPDGRPIDPALPAGAAAGAGDELAAAARLLAEVVKVLPDGRRVVRFDRPPLAVADRLGEAPLPPYIHRRLDDRERYQTVYARTPGSAAAPTAGLHFTPALIDAIASRGVGWSTVTLHIGLDTFRPVEAEHVADHRIHREWAELDPATAAAICATRRAGGRIVAVGTTAVRVLETAARQPGADLGAPVAAFHGWTDLFITPGFAFRAVDALITNFHLPRSSLLMLVAAFAGKAAIDRAYAEAVRERYRFYSFGDAMWIGSSTASTRRAT